MAGSLVTNGCGVSVLAGWRIGNDRPYSAWLRPGRRKRGGSIVWRIQPAYQYGSATKLCGG